MTNELQIQRLLGEAYRAAEMGQLALAEQFFRQVLSSNPEQPDALVGLGSIAARDQRPDEAVKFFLAAVQINPGNIHATIWAGMLLSQIGRYAESVPLLEQALTLYPEGMQVLVSLGNSFYRLGKPAKSYECFNKALALAPGDPGLLYSRAMCLRDLLLDGQAESDLELALSKAPSLNGYVQLAEIQLGSARPEVAIQTAQKAIRLDPTHAGPYSQVARGLGQLNRDQDAEPYWTRAEEIASNKETVLNARARSLNAVGRFAEAKQVLLRSVDLNPNSGETYYSIVSSQRCAEADRELVSSIEHRIGSVDLPGRDRLYMLYSLGKASNDFLEFGRAIDYFDQANALCMQLKGDDLPFDPDQFRRYIDSQIQLFTESSIASSQLAGNGSDTPIIVTGMLRSGTSLTEQILSCHPKVGGAGEQPYWHEHEAELHKPGTDKLDVELLAPLADRYLDILRRIAPGCERIIDKNPANSLILGLIASAFPKAKIIHMRRHPVDTALSIWMTPITTTANFVCNRSNIVFAYKEYERITEHWRSSIPATQYLEISYETLTEKPEETIRSMLEFCELEWDPACLHPEHNKRPVRTPSFWQVRQPLYKTSANRWKNYKAWLGEFEQLVPS